VVQVPKQARPLKILDQLATDDQSLGDGETKPVEGALLVVCR
jgi:hypothetical protein